MLPVTGDWKGDEVSKKDFQPGSSSLEDFFGWINERHRIYLKRKAGEPGPWTDDPILRTAKFTNVFRQLDRGTIALNKMIHEAGEQRDEDIVFNIWWYRLFNLPDHAVRCGFVHTYEQLRDYITRLAETDAQMFTGAYVVSGGSSKGRPKWQAALDWCKDAFRYSGYVSRQLRSLPYLENAGHQLLPAFVGVGRFVAYEIACDFRFLLPGWKPRDVYRWANTGPGAARGLSRLGIKPGTHFAGKYGDPFKGKKIPETVVQMRTLLRMAEQYCEQHVRDHMWFIDGTAKHWPPFELREIEHSLCEFDKYERLRQGHGKTRSKFRPHDAGLHPYQGPIQRAEDLYGPPSRMAESRLVCDNTSGLEPDADDVHSELP